MKSLTGAEGEYTYEWKFIPQNADKDKGADTLDFVVATTKDLELPITLKADSYTCFYRVEDKATKVSWYQKFYLQVSSLTSEGWMVLCEQDGQSRMDMIVNVDANTDIISRDIWSESDLVTGKPVKLMSNFSGAGGNIYLFTCENGTYRLDQTDMHAGKIIISNGILVISRITCTCRHPGFHYTIIINITGNMSLLIICIGLLLMRMVMCTVITCL